MSILDDEYRLACQTPSDINEHLPYLASLAENRTVVEFGVRTGVSTRALLAGRPISYTGVDLKPAPTILADLAASVNIPYQHIVGDTLAYRVKFAHLLFIDTWHTHAQLFNELVNNARAVNELIVLHDTVTFGTRDERPGKGPGLLQAVTEFLAHREGRFWRVLNHFRNNNGLMTLYRGYK